VSKGKAAAAASDSASRERLMLQLQDVERQLDEIMQGVNAEANPGALGAPMPTPTLRTALSSASRCTGGELAWRYIARLLY
jgi:hypothetical protein